MPLHDWTRVDDGIFHAFHNAWITEMQATLNGGLLPEGYYALGEQFMGAGKPDVLTLRDESASNGSGGTALLTTQPRTRLVTQLGNAKCLARQRHLVIRHASNDGVVALIEIVSAGNKAAWYPLHLFVRKAVAALEQGVHLLILDLHPPSPRDPDGIHGLMCGELGNEVYHRPDDADRTLAAYAAGLVTTAFVEPIAVGQALIDMPLFLSRDGEGYIEVPLESTYQSAYAGVPSKYRRILEAAA